ncbi:MAG: PD-(D/E)XK nuclease family protein [Clostridia bacterium]|nr:PD-(D/E)XK nuclease family protein [Clostridia bacterium]
MSLEILYGTHLQHENDTIFQMMKNCIDRGENVLYIVPEQYSFNADKVLLDTLGERYSHLTETVNFKRLATAVNKKYQPNQLNYIDEETKHLLLYKIIRQKKSELSTLKNRQLGPDSVLLFKNILSECKGYLMNHETFEQIKNNLSVQSSLYQKICDLDLIFNTYQKEIETKFRDFEDSFLVLANDIKEYELYRNYQIFIDRFTNFSPAEFAVISALLNNAKNMSVTLLADDFSKKVPGDLFYSTYKTCETLKKIAKSQQKNVKETKIDTKKDQFFKDIFDNPKKEATNKNISLTNAKNIKDEVRFVIDTIKQKTAQGASYSDFTVLSGDLSLYETEISHAFSRADIPCFMDQKSPLLENPIARIFLNLFQMVVSDYEKNAILEYLKSLCSVFHIHNDVCIFEELLHRFHLQKKDIFHLERWRQKCDFIKTQSNFLSLNLSKINTVYDSFLLPVIQNFKKQKSYMEAFRSYTDAVHLEEAVRLFLEQKEAVFRQETVTAYNTILGAIKKIDLLISEETIEPSDYCHILKQALQLYESGVVPNTVDTVTVSDIDRGRSLSSPYVFILGMNEGVTPKANTNHGYLSDLEREAIFDITGIELPTSLQQNCDSTLSLYRAFITASSHLYLLKNEAENEQSKRMPCYLWKRMEAFFTPSDFQANYVSLCEYTEQALMAYQNPYQQKLSPKVQPKDFLNGEEKAEISKLWSQIAQMKEEGYYHTDKKLSKKILDIQYQKQLNASVSRLETYQKCGYAYFVNYLLKISEREDVNYDFRKTGSIVHNLFEQFSKSLKKHQLTWETCDDAFIERQIESLVPKEILRLFPDLSLFNPRTKYLIHKIKRLLRNAISFIKEHFNEGEFIPVGYEIPIGEEGIPPLTISLEDGSVMQMFGIIDRCDIAKPDDRLFVRIVDYKSSAKEFNFALIKEGIQLQLLTYLQTVIKNGGQYLDFEGEILPGAAFYTSFGDSLLSFAERPAPDEIEKEIRKKFTMRGLVLNDDSLIRAIDKHLTELPNYQSLVSDIKTDSKGNFKLKNFLFFQEFNKLLSDCESTLKKIGNRMMKGEIAIKPYRYAKETGCDWCPYASVCMFDPKMHPYRNISKLSKEDYFQPETEKKEGDNRGN